MGEVHTSRLVSCRVLSDSSREEWGYVTASWPDDRVSFLCASYCYVLTQLWISPQDRAWKYVLGCELLLFGNLDDNDRCRYQDLQDLASPQAR
jgi:hypothetical protein